MATIKRDVNRVTVGAAVTDDSAKTITMIEVDSSTKRVKAMIIDAVLGATNNPVGQRDANHNPTFYAVTDDAAQDVVPIATDANGFIKVDINVE